MKSKQKFYSIFLILIMLSSISAISAFGTRQNNSNYMKIWAQLNDLTIPSGEQFMNNDLSINMELEGGHFEEMTLEFPLPDIIEEGEFSRISFDGCLYTLREGEPKIPIFTRTLKIPVDERIKIENVEHLSYEIMKLEKNIIPTATTLPAIHDNNNMQNKEDGSTPKEGYFEESSIYNSKKPYPSMDFNIREGFGRDYDSEEFVRYVNIDLYPVVYYPALKNIRASTKMHIQIERYKDPALSNHPVLKKNQENKAVRDDSAEMILIGPESFRAHSSELITHKTNTGLDTIYVSLEEIYDSTYFPVEGVDNPEKIKYFLKNAVETWDSMYVMLMGDSDVCPVRYSYIRDGYDDGGANHIDGDDVPTDTYYADIYNSTGDFCDWKGDGNGQYGEETDGCDFYYDIYVGRLPAGDTSELEHLINRIIYYEKNTLGQDWFQDANLHGTDTFPYGHAPGHEGEMTLDQIVDNGYLSGFDIAKYYESLGNCNKNEIVSGLNQGCGFAAFSDHGDHHCWGATGQGSGIFDKNDAAGLSNGNKLPVFTFDACLCGSFDNELKPTFWPDNPGEAISEELLLNEEGGGIAVISCTRVGWGDWGTDYYKHRSGFMDVHLYKSFQEGHRTPGRMLARACTYYMNDVGNNDVMDHKTLAEYNLLGDPSLAIGGMPTDFTVLKEIDEAKPGETCTYEIKVVNNGPFAERIDIDFSKLPESFSGSSAQNTPIASGEEKNITIQVTLPEGLLAHSNHILPIGVMSGGRGTFVNMTCSVTEEFGLELSSPVEDISTYPGEPVSFKLNISNQANCQDIVGIELQDIPQGWEVELSRDNFTMEAFSEDRITANIIPVSKSTAGNRQLVFTATSVMSNGTAYDHHAFNVIINRTYGFEIEPPMAYDVIPNQQVWIDIPIINSGNGKDDFNLEIITYPSNWAITLDDLDVRIDEFSHHNATVRVEVPEYATAGGYSFNIRVESISQDIAKIKTVNLSVAEIPDVELQFGSNNLETVNGNATNTSMEIRNRGNFRDMINISLSNFSHQLEIGGESLWDIDIPSTLVSIDAYETHFSEIRVTPGEHVEAGTYYFDFKASSSKNSSICSIQRIKVVIKPLYSCEITCAESAFNMKTGESKDIQFDLSNLGNSGDTLYVSFNTVSWISGQLVNSTYPLECFSSCEGKLSIQVDENALAGKHLIELIAVSAQDPPGDPVVSDKLTIEINVEQLYGLKILPDFPENLNITQGNAYNSDWNLEIKNTGNGIDNYEILISGEAAKWAKVEFNSFQVEADRVYDLKINITIPENIPSGKYDLDIQLRSLLDEGTSANYGTDINIKEKDSALDNAGELVKDNLMWIIIIVISAIILFIIIIALLVRKKGNKKKEKDRKKRASSKVETRPSETVEDKRDYSDLYSNMPNISRRNNNPRQSGGELDNHQHSSNDSNYRGRQDWDEDPYENDKNEELEWGEDYSADNDFNDDGEYIFEDLDQNKNSEPSDRYSGDLLDELFDLGNNDDSWDNENSDMNWDNDSKGKDDDLFSWD